MAHWYESSGLTEPVEGPPGNHHRGHARHRRAAGVGGAELHLPRISLDHTAERSDLDGPRVEHLTGTKRVQVLGRAVEEIVVRVCHVDQHPRLQSLVEVQTAEHRRAATRSRRVLRSVRGGSTAR